MKKYEIWKASTEARYTGHRLESISTELSDCDPIVLESHTTLEDGLAAPANHKSTAHKLDTMTRPVWALSVVLLVELECESDEHDWEPTGSEWFAAEDIRQPYAAPDLDRSEALAELAERYGVKEYNGRKYFLLDDERDWPEAICADDPISALDGTQKVYGLRIENGEVYDIDEGGYITWDDDGNFSR